MFVQSTENFLEAFEKSFNSKHEEDIQLKSDWNIPTKNSCFELKIFVLMPLENILYTLWTRLKHLEGPPHVYLCVDKKFWSYDTPIGLYLRKMEKKLRFWKMKPKVRLEYSEKTSSFEMNFFNGSRQFSVDFMKTFNVSGTYAWLRSLCQKKTVTSRHINQKILLKTEKKMIFHK